MHWSGDALRIDRSVAISRWTAPPATANADPGAISASDDCRFNRFEPAAPNRRPRSYASRSRRWRAAPGYYGPRIGTIAGVLGVTRCGSGRPWWQRLVSGPRRDGAPATVGTRPGYDFHQPDAPYQACSAPAPGTGLILTRGGGGSRSFRGHPVVSVQSEPNEVSYWQVGPLQPRPVRYP